MCFSLYFQPNLSARTVTLMQPEHACPQNTAPDSGAEKYDICQNSFSKTLQTDIKAPLHLQTNCWGKDDERQSFSKAVNYHLNEIEKKMQKKIGSFKKKHIHNFQAPKLNEAEISTPSMPSSVSVFVREHKMKQRALHSQAQLCNFVNQAILHWSHTLIIKRTSAVQ